MNADRPLCQTCDYYQSVVANRGQCRRHAPRAAVHAGQIAFPRVSPDDWCGEHSSLPQLKYEIAEELGGPPKEEPREGDAEPEGTPVGE